MSVPEGTDELFQGILASAQTGIYVVQDGKFQYINPQFREYTGYTNEELIGKYSLELVHPDDRERVRGEVIRRLKGEGSSPYEYRIIRKDGQIRWIMERIASIQYKGRQATVGSYMDTTHKKALDDRIRRHYRELSALSQISAAVSRLHDLNTILQVALDNSLSIIDGTIGGILLLDEQSQTLSYRVHRGLSERYVDSMRLGVGEGVAGRVAETGKPMLLEDISGDPQTAKPDLITTEGLKAFVSVPLGAKSKVLGVLNVASYLPRQFGEDDMNLLNSIGDEIGVAIEEAELYGQLNKERQNYRQLARLMLVAQETERSRIARELHDETTQSLTGLSLNMQALLDIAKTSDFGDVGFRHKLEEVYCITSQLNSEISKIMKALRPTALDSLGLAPAIRQYAENRLQPLGTAVSIKHEGMEERLSPETEFGLFRIAQEAITNIVWHSGAKNATISTQRTPDEFIMEIEDDGKGFDASRPIEVEESGRGQGIFSMKERVNLLSGTCNIYSQLGKGTRIVVKVPVYWSKADAKDKGADSG